MGLNGRCLSSAVSVTTLLFCLAAATTSASSSAVSGSPILVSTGLQNLGNTCYMNAQLQCAYHVPRIRQIIKSHPSPLEQNPAEEVEEAHETSEPSIGLQALRQVFQQMEVSSQQHFAGPVSPRALCQTLGIPVMEQQDSQEFWKLLLPALQLPALMDLYQGAYEDYITAVDGTGRERRQEEPFLDLSLDLTSDSVLASMEDMFGTPELLSEAEGNGWRPEKGADKVDALKGSLLRVQGLPSLLQLHLKRFRYDWQTDVMSKVNDRFSFPKILDLSKICSGITKEEEASAVYDLQSVVVHVGEYGSGHYYAYVRPDIQRDVWYRFDDHEVTEVSFWDIIKDAYGGKSVKTGDARKEGFLKRMLSFGAGGANGWGGRTSSAYMLQYARRSDIPMLYADEQI